MSFQKPDIVTVLEGEGLQLKQKGKNLWALCPLHCEKVSSFKIDPDKQRWHCFGCNRGGDIISFIQEYKGLSFKKAIKYLGINGKPYKPDSQELKKRKLIRKFEEWCRDYHNDLCILYRTLQRAKMRARTIEDIEALTEFYHKEPLWLCQIEILEGDDGAKLELFKEVVYGR
ncbi:MAG: CHC2 zinc finger domain-containing protein [Candidatus Edwardsbacteria bacterium]